MVEEMVEMVEKRNEKAISLSVEERRLLHNACLYVASAVSIEVHDDYKNKCVSDATLYQKSLVSQYCNLMKKLDG